MADDKSFKRTRRKAVLYTPIAALLIVLLVIFGVSVFFRVSDIEVTGTKKYDTEKVVEVSGIKIGDNLIFVDPAVAAEQIKTSLPYLSDVQIDKIIPDRISITVTESQPMAVISYNGAWWLLDQKARVLDKTSTGTASDKIEVTGVDPTSVTVGKQIEVDSSEQTKLLYLANVLSAIESAGIARDVGMLEMANIGSIRFTYLGRFTVILGNGEDADYKMVRMQNVIKQLKPDDRGKIDLSNDKVSRFISE